MFCGQDMLARELRPSWRDPASIASAVIKLLAARLRQAWPGVRLVVRSDSGFSHPKVLRRLEALGIDYVLGVQKNPALEWHCALAARAVADRHAASVAKERLIGEFRHAARSWDRERRVDARLEHGVQGADARFAVTSLDGAPGSCTSGCTAPAARPRTASRKRSWTRLTAAPVASATRPTGCGCCWRPWPTR